MHAEQACPSARPSLESWGLDGNPRKVNASFALAICSCLRQDRLPLLSLPPCCTCQGGLLWAVRTGPLQPRLLPGSPIAPQERAELDRKGSPDQGTQTDASFPSLPSFSPPSSSPLPPFPSLPVCSHLPWACTQCSLHTEFRSVPPDWNLMPTTLDALVEERGAGCSAPRIN